MRIPAVDTRRATTEGAEERDPNFLSRRPSSESSATQWPSCLLVPIHHTRRRRSPLNVTKQQYYAMGAHTVTVFYSYSTHSRYGLYVIVRIGNPEPRVSVFSPSPCQCGKSISCRIIYHEVNEHTPHYCFTLETGLVFR